MDIFAYKNFVAFHVVKEIQSIQNIRLSLFTHFTFIISTMIIRV